MPIRFRCPLANLPGLQADAIVDDSAFKVLVEPRDLRRLRASLMELAYMANSRDVRRSFLLLEEPQITEIRLMEEWSRALGVVRPEILTRLGMLVRRGGQWTGTPTAPAPEEVPVLEQILQHELASQPKRAGRGSEAVHEILRILIHHWLLGKGAITVTALMEASGNSYPTVSRALERLAHCLTRHSDRSVELRYFPREEWAKLVAVADDVRSTVRFADRSGQPRSPESLLRRLRMLGRQDIAMGGVWGAKHYFPPLDLVGTPRLDLSIHSAGKAVDLSFIERLDPGLEPTTRRDQAATLVLHTIRRATSFFEPDKGSVIPWADPVECLLDLHEARLEPQAMEFLASFTTKGRKS